MLEYLNILLPLFYVVFAGYLVFSEIKGLKKKTPKSDVFVDNIIALVIMGISIYQIYKLKCNLNQYLTYLYLLVTALGYVYAVVAKMHDNAVKGMKKASNEGNATNEIKEENETENKDNIE